MPKKSSIFAIALLVAISSNTLSYGDGTKDQNRGDWINSGNRVSDNRQLNVGNYLQLENNQNPAVVSKAHEDATATSSQLSNGYLSNYAPDNSPIGYKLGSPVLTNPTPYIVWYGSWNNSPNAGGPTSLSGNASAFGSFTKNSKVITVSGVGGTIQANQQVIASGIPAGTLVVSVSGTTVTISKSSTSASTSTGVIFNSSNLNNFADYKIYTDKLLSGLSTSTRWSGIMQNYYSRNASIGSVKSNVGALNVSPANYKFVAANTSLYGSVLTQTSILNIAKTAFASVNNQAIVIVIPSADIPVTGFNYGTIQFCGYHSYSGNIAYGFVGDSSVTTWCQGQPTATNNLGADSMSSVLIHEIEEATSDPLLNAWISPTTVNENADKCAWNFGTFSSSAPYFNYSWMSTNYLIQQEFAINNLYVPVSGINGTAAKGASTITLTGTSGLTSGMYIFGTGIPANAYISSINLSTKVISIAASNRTTTVTLALSNTPLTFSTTNLDPSKNDVWNGACSK